MIKLELKKDDVQIVHEALEIADSWHIHTKRFLAMKKYYKEIMEVRN